jgi:hypothetical protein
VTAAQITKRTGHLEPDNVEMIEAEEGREHGRNGVLEYWSNG